MSEPLTKVDSAIDGLHEIPDSSAQTKGHRRASSSVTGVLTPQELYESKTPIQVAVETQRTGWKINSSITTVEEKEIMDRLLTTPPVRVIDLMYPQGKTLTVRNKHGVQIKDALKAIHKASKNTSEDVNPEIYLTGFRWDGERKGLSEDEVHAEWCRLNIVLQTTPTVTGFGSSGGKKKKNKGGD